MMENITVAIEESYGNIGDTFVFLIEDRPDCAMVNGQLGSDNPKYDEFAKRNR